MLWEMVYPSWDFDEPCMTGRKSVLALPSCRCSPHPGTPPARSASMHLNLAGKTAKAYSFRAIPSSRGGPGATGRSYSDFDTIIDSIESKLLTLPESTAVLTGHGDSTGIGVEAPDLDAWKKRGH